MATDQKVGGSNPLTHANREDGNHEKSWFPFFFMRNAGQSFVEAAPITCEKKRLFFVPCCSSILSKSRLWAEGFYRKDGRSESEMGILLTGEENS